MSFEHDLEELKQARGTENDEVKEVEFKEYGGVIRDFNCLLQLVYFKGDHAMIRSFLVAATLAALSLAPTAALAGFINKVTVTIVAKPTKLKVLIKAAERALENAKIALIEAKGEPDIGNAKASKKKAEERVKELKERAPDKLGYKLDEPAYKLLKKNVQNLEIAVLFGKRILNLETKMKIVDKTDSEITIEIVVDLHQKQLRESISDKGKLRITKKYSKEEANKGNGIWDITQVSVVGYAQQYSSKKLTARTGERELKFIDEETIKGDKEDVDPVPVELLVANVREKNVDAQLIFAGEDGAASQCYWKKKDVRVVYEFRFANAVK